ncbi:MAG: alpha-L-fucosidase [Planctomycetota bacterium]
MATPPRYLQDYAAEWTESPHEANLAWWQDAAFGLFLHYGLYSQLGRHEWVLFREAIPLAEYEQLFESFDPKHFDADFITDLALEAGMKYVNLTSCHHEGFCLWKSDIEAFNAYNACGRDLVRELGEQCAKKGLGFFTYFTYILNWRHPYALTRDRLPSARPAYEHEEERYVLTRPEEWDRYWAWSHGCIRELAAFDFPLAGIWLDIIMGYYALPDLVPLEETYRIIREARPEALLSFKQGATGEEDFASPEFHFASKGEKLRENGDERGARIADEAWAINRRKHNEICMTLQSQGWGYTEASSHKTADELWGSLAYARAHDCNLLANTGPLPDGSIHPEDVACLRAIGERIRREGLPPAADAVSDAGHEDAPTA